MDLTPPSLADATGDDDSATGTPQSAQSHARAQGATVVEHMPTIPASRAERIPVGVDPSDLVWAERVAPGGYTHRVIAPGTMLRLTDLEGDACAHVSILRADQHFERLCVADTVKVQWQAYLTAGALLLSAEGRVLASIIEDTSGHHDALLGTSSARRNIERYGQGSPESATPAGRELLLLAGAKHGLGPRDLPPTLSFFKGIRIDPVSGSISFEGSAGPGAQVTLRAELPLLILIANTAHPADPRPIWSSSTLDLIGWCGAPTSLDDPIARATPEGFRAFLNNHEDWVARSGTAGRVLPDERREDERP